jgi:ADP-ribose pyrophosphatase YjhB (NUDIX family)
MTVSEIKSDIQNQIISRLKNADILKYSELQPKNIPNDLFNYHLQFLVKKGFLNKTTKGYSLSKTGIQYVADAKSLNSKTNQILFKVNPIMILSRLEKGKIQILNQVRKSHPSYGKKGVPGGVLRKGESMEDAASRKFKAETGLDANFKIIGMMRRFMFVENELFSDVFFPIMYSKKYSGTLVNTEYGDNAWVSIDEAIKNEYAQFDSIACLPKVLRTIKKGTISQVSFFYEEDTQVGNF